MRKRQKQKIKNKRDVFKLFECISLIDCLKDNEESAKRAGWLYSVVCDLRQQKK